MRQTADIHAFPISRRQMLPLIRARDLAERRRLMQHSALGAGLCGVVTLLCAICAYALFLAALMSLSMLVWGAAMVMTAASAALLYRGSQEYRDYAEQLRIYRLARRV
jgi:Kef-type K+ transport system membrane component KefB